MYYKTREDALKAWNKFVTEYYSGNASGLFHKVSYIDRYGYQVAVYDYTGSFLTLI